MSEIIEVVCNQLREQKNKTVIHSTAIIDPSAQISENVTIGPYAVIGPNVEIGEGCQIDSHAVIAKNTKMGCDNTIASFASIGGDPQDLSYHGEQTWLIIGDHNIFRESCTINRGSAHHSGDHTTHIGHHNCFLAYAHVAHDSVIGNHILFTNNASVAGHVRIHDYAILGAFTAVHQFCQVGSYSFLSRATEISKDVPPYMLVKGMPGFPCGLNLVGLKRRGFTLQEITEMKEAYRIMYRRSLKMVEIVEQLKVLAEKSPVIQLILDFIAQSNRGIARKSYE